MSDNQELKAIAEKVLKKANIDEDQKFGSIIAILMVISIILTLVRVLQECNKTKTENMTSQDKYQIYGESIRSFSKKRGWFTRMRVKRAVRRELTQDEFNKYGLKLTESLLDAGENLQDNEVATLVEAAHV